MIKYKIVPSNNRFYLHHKKLYLLKSRDTYYGVHSELFLNEIDPLCSKTALVVFIKKSDAVRFKKKLDSEQKSGKSYNRIIENSISNVINSTSISHQMDVEEIDIDKLRILCYLHFFNIYIINDIIKINKKIILYGSEFSTHEYPSRQMIEYTLYKSLE